jgi:hypothetical protein
VWVRASFLLSHLRRVVFGTDAWVFSSWLLSRSKRWLLGKVCCHSSNGDLGIGNSLLNFCCVWYSIVISWSVSLTAHIESTHLIYAQMYTGFEVSDFYRFRAKREVLSSVKLRSQTVMEWRLWLLTEWTYFHFSLDRLESRMHVMIFGT